MANVDVYVQKTKVGLLNKSKRSADSSEHHSFTYQSDADEAISLAMPLRTESYLFSELHPVFQMNLPEGHLRSYLERATAKHFGSDDLTLLTLLGNNQIGRMQYCLQGQALPDGEADLPELGDILASRDDALFDQLLSRFALRSGIAGVQPKMIVDAVSDKSTLNVDSYVVKSWGEEFPQLACNEYVCLSLCRNAGLEVADFYLSENARLFINKRFDLDEADQPLGFEDFCVLQGKSTREKYDASLESCANTIRQYLSAEYLRSGLRDFFKLCVINVLIQNGDAHLKNSGIIYGDLKGYTFGANLPQARRLAPVYDVVSTTPYITNDIMALSLSGSKRWPKWKVLKRFAQSHCDLSAKQTEEVLAEVMQAVEPTQNLLTELADKHEEFAPIATHMNELLVQGIT